MWQLFRFYPKHGFTLGVSLLCAMGYFILSSPSAEAASVKVLLNPDFIKPIGTAGTTVVACFKGSPHNIPVKVGKRTNLVSGRFYRAPILVREVIERKLRSEQARYLKLQARRKPSQKALDAQLKRVRIQEDLVKFLDQCATTQFATITPTPTPTPTPTAIARVRTLAYATFAPAAQSLAGLLTVPRPIIYQHPDASTTKQALDQMPPGHKVLMDLGSSQQDTMNVISSDPRDYSIDPVTQRAFPSFWWEQGVSRLKPHYEAFYRDLAARGGNLDYVAVDFEAGFSMWSFNAASADFPIFQRAVENDPRWPALRNQLTQAGIPANATFAQMFDFWNHTYYLIFNDVMGKRAAQYASEVFFEPARRYFPAVQLSNYGYYNTSSAFPVRDFNGHRLWLGGNGAVVGTHQALSAYGTPGSLRFQSLDGTTLYQPTAFNAFRHSINEIRASVLGSTNPTDFWVAPRNWSGSLFGNNDFYQENLIHGVLAGAQRVLYWNPAWGNPTEPDRYVNESILELDNFTGYADRQSLVSNLQGWGDDYVLSCVRANRSRVCRFTSQEPITTSGIAQSSSQVVLRFGKTEVTFSQGTATRSGISRYGVWVEQPIEAPAPQVTIEGAQ